MKVILKEKVKSLGNIGEIVDVSPGYARNYLFPKSLGVSANENNKKRLVNLQRSLTKKITGEKTSAQETAKKLQSMELEFFKKVGSNGKLFGSVSTDDLSRELLTKGIEIEKRLISLKNSIKTAGTFEAKAKIFSGIEATFLVKVTMDPKQALELKKKSSIDEEKEKNAVKKQKKKQKVKEQQETQESALKDKD